MLSSALTFTTLNLPAQTLASSWSTESKTWHGRLQGAQNSTRTGCLDSSTSALKSTAVITGSASVWVFKFSVFFNMTKLYARPVPRGGQERNALKERL